MRSNIELLQERASAYLKHRSPESNISASTLSDAIAKTADTVRTDTLLRIDAYIKSFNNNSPRSIYSYPRCSKPATLPATALQKCNFCADNPLFTAKLFLDFTITDNAVNYSLEAYPKAAEQILNIKASRFHLMTAEDKHIFIEDTLHSLQHKKMAFVIAPNASRFEDYREIEWELKYIDGPHQRQSQSQDL